MNSHFEDLDHDTWQYALPKIRSAGKIQFGDVHGVLPYTGVRNPITTSSVSQKVSFTYRTAANNWQPKIGAAESMAEAAVAMEALVSPYVYDVEFQPTTFPYVHPNGQTKHHTIDLRITYNTGERCFVFVRNSTSLNKRHIQDEIDTICHGVPESEAHSFAVIDGDAYSRPRRDNLRRMHHLVHFQPDARSDEVVEAAFETLQEVWHLSDLFGRLPLSGAQITQSVLRLIATGKLDADCDAVICEHSHIWSASDD